MKLVIDTVRKSKPANSYLIRVPNYFDLAKIDELLRAASEKLPASETIHAHTLYGDGVLTIDERDQLDCKGKILKSPVELRVDYEF